MLVASVTLPAGGGDPAFLMTADIINESLVWGLDVYAIKTPHEQHDFLEKKMVSPTFAAAVKAWLRKNG